MALRLRMLLIIQSSRETPLQPRVSYTRASRANGCLRVGRGYIYAYLERNIPTVPSRRATSMKQRPLPGRLHATAVAQWGPKGDQKGTEKDSKHK
jgi:hypothetical protein